MNPILLGLTALFVIFVLGTVFWLIATLAPLRRKQLARKQAREQAEQDAKGPD
ncbi:MAG: hypothetical protein NWQ45_06535 [Congregibacter sp.]|nr:hypothetical protein [Congregibacter sp.]